MNKHSIITCITMYPYIFYNIQALKKKKKSFLKVLNGPKVINVFFFWEKLFKPRYLIWKYQDALISWTKGSWLLPYSSVLEKCCEIIITFYCVHNIFFNREREFQPMTSTSDNSFLLSDQNTNQFLIHVEIEP